MQAVGFAESANLESKSALTVLECPKPSPKPEEVLIQVEACGVNRADLAQRAGAYPPPPGASDILGLECSGHVCERGSGVPDEAYLAIGAPVIALLAGGGYAKYVAVPWQQIAPLPKGMDMIQGAGIMEVFATAWLNLMMLGQMKEGERLLVHAAASGVGLAAIQIAKRLKCDIMATASSEDKLQAARDLGASACFARGEDMFEAIRAHLGGNGVDIILDPVGASYLAGNIGCLSADGRLILIGLMGGAKTEIDLVQVLIKRTNILGSTIRARSTELKGRVIEQLYDNLWPEFVSGQLHVSIDRVWPLEEVEAAHQHMADNKNTGKIILDLSQISADA